LTRQHKCDQVNGNFLNFLKAFVPANSQHAVCLVLINVLEKHTAPFRKFWHIHNKTTWHYNLHGHNMGFQSTFFPHKEQEITYNSFCAQACTPLLYISIAPRVRNTTPTRTLQLKRDGIQMGNVRTVYR